MLRLRRGGPIRSACFAFYEPAGSEGRGSDGHENCQRESDEGEQGLRFDHDDLRFVDEMASALLVTNSLYRHLSDAVESRIASMEA